MIRRLHKVLKIEHMGGMRCKCLILYTIFLVLLGNFELLSYCGEGILLHPLKMDSIMWLALSYGILEIKN